VLLLVDWGEQVKDRPEVLRSVNEWMELKFYSLCWSLKGEKLKNLSIGSSALHFDVE
jgi:hypothetical protein